MTYFLETYGCQMNVAESAAMELRLKERGWEAALDGSSADLVLFNTCSVRATAETRVMGRLAQYGAMKKNRSFSLAVAGCMAERLKEELKTKVPAVDYVIGTRAKSRFDDLLTALESGQRLDKVDEDPVYSFASSHLEEGAFRAFLPIMHGCDNFCSYCIVPYLRGREISRSPESVLQELALLEDSGVRELTLLGQNVNSYRFRGEDGTVTDFPALLRLVAEHVDGIRWIRFLSSHPKDLSDAAIQVMAEYPVFCRHIHLCVQHGSDRILSAMNRKYTRADYLALVERIRQSMPDVSLSTDLLVGFPGETEEDVGELLSLMEEVRFEYAYMYHYNPREGTAAFTLPNRIADAVKKERLSRVIDLQRSITRDLMRGRIGSSVRVLVESEAKRGDGDVLGRTAQDEMVVFPGTPALVGSFVDVNLSSLRGNTFRAKEVVSCRGV